MGEAKVVLLRDSGGAPPNAILEDAKDYDLETVIVIGEPCDGQLFVSTSSGLKNRDMLWLLQQAIQSVLNGDHDE